MNRPGVTTTSNYVWDSLEFELELHSDTAGWQLAAETLTGAIPALAPFAMAQLGLLGMLYCWRHPAGTLGNGPG